MVLLLALAPVLNLEVQIGVYFREVSPYLSNEASAAWELRSTFSELFSSSVLPLYCGGGLRLATSGECFVLPAGELFVLMPGLLIIEPPHGVLPLVAG